MDHGLRVFVIHGTGMIYPWIFISLELAVWVGRLSMWR